MSKTTEEIEALKKKGWIDLGNPNRDNLSLAFVRTDKPLRLSLSKQRSINPGYCPGNVTNASAEELNELNKKAREANQPIDIPRDSFAFLVFQNLNISENKKIVHISQRLLINDLSKFVRENLSNRNMKIAWVPKANYITFKNHGWNPVVDIDQQGYSAIFIDNIS
jgi:hypothetical protein